LILQFQVGLFKPLEELLQPFHVAREVVTICNDVVQVSETNVEI